MGGWFVQSDHWGPGVSAVKERLVAPHSGGGAELTDTAPRPSAVAGYALGEGELVHTVSVSAVGGRRREGRRRGRRGEGVGVPGVLRVGVVMEGGSSGGRRRPRGGRWIVQMVSEGIGG